MQPCSFCSRRILSLFFAYVVLLASFNKLTVTVVCTYGYMDKSKHAEE